MGRLSTLKPRTAVLGKRIGDSPARERMSGRPWQRIRARVLRRDPLCVLCLEKGHTVSSVEVDHIVPLEQGGSDADANLRGLCHDCHAAKTADEQRVRAGLAPFSGVAGAQQAAGCAPIRAGGWVESSEGLDGGNRTPPFRGFFSALGNTGGQ